MVPTASYTGEVIGFAPIAIATVSVDDDHFLPSWPKLCLSISMV